MTLRNLIKHRWLALGLVAMTSACSQPVKSDAVTLDEARTAVEAGQAVLVDLREPQEHARGVAKQARLLPMSQLNGRYTEIPRDPGKPVYLICATQNRSSASLKALRAQGGYEHVRYVVGGMSGWAQRGWPMSSPPQ
jgi:rhodanese-related sulfurtransferase